MQVDADCNNSAQRCCSNVCVETASCALSVTQVLPPGGFQNGGEFITLKGDGFAAGMKVFIEKGRAPVRIVDAQTARIEAPPGPVGCRTSPSPSAARRPSCIRATRTARPGLETAWEQKPLGQGARRGSRRSRSCRTARVLVAGGTTVPDDASMSLATAEIYTRSSDM